MLRGFAALSVVMLHLAYDYNNQFQPERISVIRWTPLASHGVTLFFLISGFVIFMSVERAKRPIDFVISRCGRLYPPYWAAVILSTVVLIVFPVIGTPGVKSLLKRAVVNLTMFQSWVHVNHIDPVYWTLRVEMSFYLIMLILIWLKATRWALAVMSGLVLLAVLDHLFLPRVEGSMYSSLREILMLDNACAFAAGIVLYRARSGWKLSYLGILLLCVASPATAWVEPVDPLLDSIFFVGLSALVYASSVGWLDFLTIRPLLYLGTISYSLYLTHHWIGVVIRDRLDRAGFQPDFTLFVAVLATLVVASLIHSFVERPSMEWIRRRFRKTDAAPVASGPQPALGLDSKVSRLSQTPE